MRYCAVEIISAFTQTSKWLLWNVWLVIVAIYGPAFGTAYTYSDGAGTLTWSNSSNWSPAGIPGAGDTAAITGGEGPPTNNGWTVTYDYTGTAVQLTSLTISHNLTLIHGADVLTIADGTTTLQATNEYIGDSGNKGYGVITQTGGNNDVGTAIELGVDASDIGTYNLSSDGQLYANVGTLNVGMAGTGTFNESGGSVYLSTLAVAQSSGAGTYNLNSGYLSAITETIGNSSGTGAFVQIGGTNDAEYANVTIGAKGSYSLSGTSALLSSTESLAGTFNQSAGTHTVGSNTSGSGYYLYITSGTYNLSQTGVLAVHGDEKIGINNGDVGTFIQTGGQHTIDYGNFTIGDSGGSTGSYTLSGGTLSAIENETVGNSGIGTFTQSAATSNTVGGTLYIGAGSTYTLGDTASLSVTSGESIYGTFTQTSGSNFASSTSTGLASLSLAGSYQLSGGELNLNGLELISGSMTQSGGTSIVTGTIPDVALAIVGSLSGGTATGSYTLSSGATLTVNGAVHVGGINVSSGTTVANEAIPSGVLTVSGGVLTVSELIKLWTGPGNAIHFSAGSISTPELIGDASEFTWTGGTLNITSAAGLTIGEGAFFQNLSLNSEMTLDSAGINLTSSGILTLAGGVLNSNGVITLSGGTFSGGSTAWTNAQQITGYGIIAGSAGFTNSGVITVPNGNLVLSTTGALSNTGTITISPGTQLQLTGGNLVNTGMINVGGGALAGTATLSNGTAGVIEGYGTISAPIANNAGGTILVQTGAINLTHAMTNAGTINLLGPASSLIGSAITNNGVITGNGAVNNTLSNSASGEIRATSGQWLTIKALSANAGKINLQGGAAEFVAALSNTGSISGHGALYADAGLTNTGKMVFSSGYTDVNGAITNNSGGTITVTGGGFTTFYNALTNNAGATVQVSADSVATFEGAVTGSGSFTGAGTKIFDGGAPSSVIALATIVGSTVVETPANLFVNSFDENSINVQGVAKINPGGSANQTNSLTIGSLGKLDLANNSLAVSCTGESPAPTIRGYLTNGYDAGKWDGAGGIDSSTAATSHGATSLGYFDNGTTVLIKFTWTGDANLDGLVNSADLSAISIAGNAWQTGDFNYDGKVNADDYSLLMFGLAKSGGANIFTTLPEPGAAAVLFAGGFLLLNKRRF